ncbi:hypothetical protein [Nonomuraea sp. CA-141351]
MWRLGQNEPLLRITLEARVSGLSLPESGVLFAAISKGLAAFRLELLPR